MPHHSDHDHDHQHNPFLEQVGKLPDYYRALGVSRKAIGEEIDKAFRKLSLKFHPDKNPGNAKAAEEFKKLSNHREVLRDPQQRALREEDLGRINPQRLERRMGIRVIGDLNRDHRIIEETRIKEGGGIDAVPQVVLDLIRSEIHDRGTITDLEMTRGHTNICSTTGMTGLTVFLVGATIRPRHHHHQALLNRRQDPHETMAVMEVAIRLVHHQELRENIHGQEPRPGPSTDLGQAR
ncbi:hypothetical protein LTS08_004227 [Lithohypha guttulata]|uniref:uncharacterized protein n=1 Tax=Lithohypha guttulata TaxID=1690604 RepID=UPI002DDDC037|nr:hypothetical protein LTR51_005784 [Lithohypha guttulata]KAK5101768.1 hypothetical protein LTS08_004227 [Lithohypha guttulata]